MTSQCKIARELTPYPQPPQVSTLLAGGCAKTRLLALLLRVGSSSNNSRRQILSGDCSNSPSQSKTCLLSFSVVVDSLAFFSVPHNLHLTFSLSGENLLHRESRLPSSTYHR